MCKDGSKTLQLKHANTDLRKTSRSSRMDSVGKLRARLHISEMFHEAEVQRRACCTSNDDIPMPPCAHGKMLYETKKRLRTNKHASAS